MKKTFLLYGLKTSERISPDMRGITPQWGFLFLVSFLLFSKSQGLADKLPPEEEDENYNVVSLYV